MEFKLEGLAKENQQKALQIENLGAAQKKTKFGEEDLRRESKELRREVQDLTKTIEELTAAAAKHKQELQVSLRGVKQTSK